MAGAIATEGFARHLGVELESSDTDCVTIRMPYQQALGEGRVHGGAISALIDIAATAAFWSHPDVGPASRGATVDFTVNFLKLAVATDLSACATVRRRGGSICVGDVVVSNPEGEEVAIARVTYKLNAAH